MKKLLKILTYFIGIILFLIIVLTVIAKLAENKITDLVLKKLSESVEAPVTIENVSFNLLRKFPLATIELENVMLGAHKISNDLDTDSTNVDTIMSIQKVYVSVKSKPLFKGIIEVKKVDLDGAMINYLVDTTGLNNIDFLIASSDTSETDTLPSDPLDLTLTDLSIKSLICNYDDLSLKAKARIVIPDLKVKAKLKGENILASVKGDISLSKCSFDETNLYLMNNADIHFNMDYENDSLSINQFKVSTDGAQMNLLGSVLLGDEIKMDLFFEGSDLILNELIKYAPKEMLQEYGLKKLAGTMNLDATLQGIYSETELPKVDLTINFKEGSVSTVDYPMLKNISFKGKITNGILRNNQSTQANFSSFHFETNQSQFDFVFSVLDMDHPKYDLKADMKLNIAEFRKYIPDSLVQSIDGRMNLNFSTKGELPDSIGDDFTDYLMANSRANVEFVGLNVTLDSLISIRDLTTQIEYKPNYLEVNNLELFVPSYNAQLKNTSFNVNIKGSINNTSEMSLDLKSFHIEKDGSEMSGSAKVKNFDKPSYTFSSSIKLYLDEVKKMLPDTLVNTLTGKVYADIESSGTLNLDSISDQAMDIVFKSSSFNLDFENVFVEMPDYPLYKMENLTGQLNMNPDAIQINQMSGILGGLIFSIDSTEIWNTYKVFIQEQENEMITVQTNIVLGEINNNLLGAFMSTDTSDEDMKAKDLATENTNLETSTASVNDTINASQAYLLPNLKELGVPHFLVRGKLAIQRLEYEKNIIDDISLKFRFTDSLYVLEDFKLKTCGGDFNTAVKLDARKWDKPVVDLRSYIDNLDVKQLLMVNDNFGDTSLTYEKVNGILTSELHVRAFYVDGLWPTDRVRAEGHFTLKDGRIYDYEPLVDLSKNKLLGGLKGLDKLDFNTLTTSIFMLNDKIYIPKTDIVTSSMDITAFAMHSMKDDYEYHFKIHLGDVLKGKSEKIMKAQAKQNKVDGSTVDRNGIKLVSLKKGKDKKNGFDNDKLEKEFLKDLNKQKGFLRLLFKSMLVNFSTDLDRTIRNKELMEKYGGKNEQ